MMVFKNMKEKVRSTDDETDIFEIIAGVFQWDTFASYTFIIWPDKRW